MFRISFLIPLLFALLVASGCTTSNNTAETPPAEVDPDTQAVVDPAAEMTTGVDGLYSVKVLDATIKSPRKELTGKVGDAVEVKINYGSPAVNGRTIYGDLVPYGKVWRTGANEATRITFSAPVRVGEEQTELAAGTYSLFTLPTGKEDWTVIFNKTADQWGAYDYAEDQDAARVKASAATLPSPAERMEFALEEGGNITMMWADMKVSFPVMPAAK